MRESKPFESAGPRDFSAVYFWSGIAAVALGAGLFHPGAGLILVGLALAWAGIFGGPQKT